MSTPEEEEFDYENDDSWYEDAMNTLDSPVFNHHIIYSEEEIKDLEELEKTTIRLRNKALENGFEYIDLKIGDYVCDIVFFCGTVDYNNCSFALTYKKDRQYLVIFRWKSEAEPNPNPVLMAGMVRTSKFLGAYRFVEFLHLEEEIEEEQENIETFKINRELTYKDKPSLEVIKSDDLKYNQKIVDYFTGISPAAFEFYNEFVIFEMPVNTDINQYLDMMDQIENL